MIKRTVEDLLHKLNNLDPESDTCIKFDFDNKVVIASQRLGHNLVLNEMFLLVPCINKGVKYSILLKGDLSRLKNLLIYWLNRFDESQVSLTNKGFKLMVWQEILVSGGIKRVWMTYETLNLIANPFKIKILAVISSVFRGIYKQLHDTKIQ